MKGCMNPLTTGDFTQIPSDSTSLPPEAPAPHLLSLPPELFDIICSNLLPSPSDQPLYNRFNDVELEQGFHVPEKRLCTDFINLAVTSKSAYLQCFASFQPKSLVVSLGWAGSEATIEEQKKQIESFEGDLELFYWRASEGRGFHFLDIAVGAGLKDFTGAHRFKMTEAMRSNPDLKAVRYLGKHFDLPLFGALPKSLDYLEIYHSGARDALDFADLMSPLGSMADGDIGDDDLAVRCEPIRIQTLVISDRLWGVQMNLMEHPAGDSTLWANARNGDTAVKFILGAVTSVKKLVLRIAHYIDGDERQGEFDPIECLGLLKERIEETTHLDTLEELVLEFKEYDLNGMGVGGGHDFYVGSLGQWLQGITKINDLQSLSTLRICIQLNCNALDEEELEQLDDRYLLTNWETDDLTPIADWTQSTFLPSPERLQASLETYIVPLPHVTRVELQVRLVPTKDKPHRRQVNPPLLDFVAEIDRSNGAVVNIKKQDRTNEWVEEFIPKLKRDMAEWVVNNTPEVHF